MGYAIMFRSSRDADDYREAGRRAKHGLKAVMEAVERNDMRSAMEGVEMAWDGVKEMCEISKEMEDRYSERRYDGIDQRGGHGNRYDMRGHDWNERDDEWMERRMRDSMGRFR